MMAKITFIEPDGTRVSVDAQPAERILDLARNNDIKGIVGECGGELACATCHVRVDAGSFAKLDPAGEVELELLDCAFDRQQNSRLACQMTMSAELDGMVLELPSRQT